MTDENGLQDRTAYLRQLALDSLIRYSGGFAELERLDRDLKSIIRSLRGVADSDLTDSLLRQWGQLEIIYGSALNDDRLRLTEDEEADVRDIVAGLVAQLRVDEPPSGE